MEAVPRFQKAAGARFESLQLGLKRPLYEAVKVRPRLHLKPQAEFSESLTLNAGGSMPGLQTTCRKVQKEKMS